jgi:hypothetical protein
MSVLVYVIGGVSIAVGAVILGWYLLSWAAGAIWPRLRHVGRTSPARMPGARFVSSLGLLLAGTLLVLSVNDKSASWLGAVATTALLIWQLASMLMSHGQRESAS